MFRPIRTPVCRLSNTLMLGSRNSSTASWRTRQARDPFVKARVEGNYRSRAALKLLEIEERYKILPKASSSSVVVDLGCAPGGWAQVCSQLMGLDNEEAPNERVNLVGVDLLYMEPVQGCRFIQGDCLDPETWTKITALLPPEAQNKVEVVLSDMAPNISGNAIADAEAALEICESVLQFSKLHAQKGSTMLLKHFTFPEIDQFRKAKLSKAFKTITYIKPKSSRKESNEGYFLCRGFKG